MIPRDLSRRRFLSLTVAAAATFPAAACGTILYPGRRGQPAGRLDPTVIILDGLLLLLFVVPGVIAFAVDFATGAIYLPPSGYGRVRPDDFDPDAWQRVAVDPHELTPERVERVVLVRTGRRVRLDPAVFEARKRHAQAAVQTNDDGPVSPE